MKRAPIIEDWSRFNRAVLEIADDRSQPTAPRQPAPQPPKHEPAERVSEPDGHGGTYGLIARHRWRKHA